MANTRFSDLAGNVDNVISSTSWTVDATPPTSSVRALAPVQTGYGITLNVAGSDPAPAAGVGVSGLKSFRIDDSVDNGPFQTWTTLPAVNNAATATFPAVPGHLYSFRSVASDFAGNVEVKTVYAEATTSVPDLSPPATSIASAVADPVLSRITLTLSGTDPGGSGLGSFGVYAQVDGGPFQFAGRIGAGRPGNSGAYTATFLYSTDGAAHTYRFYSLGTDNAGNVEAVPPASGFSTVTTLPRAGNSALSVTRLAIQGGAAERSFINAAEIDFNQTNTAGNPVLANVDREQSDQAGPAPALGRHHPDPRRVRPVEQPGPVQGRGPRDRPRFRPPRASGGVARGSLSLAAGLLGGPDFGRRLLRA